MKNNLYKFLFIIGIVILTFFIKQSKVSAKEFFTCPYVSPLAFIDENGRPTDIEIQITYKVPELRGGLNNVVPGARFGFYDTEFHSSLSSFCAGDNLALILETPIKYNSKYANIDQSIIRTKDKLNINSSYDYAKVYVDGNSYKVVESNESEYKKYISGNQYKGAKDSTNLLYNKITISKLKTNLYFSDKYDCVFKCDMTGVGNFKDSSDNLKSYIKSVGGIIFVKSDLKENYPNTNLTKYKQMLSLATDASNNKLSSEDQENALNGLATVIDTNSQNNGSITKSYFDSTKTLWNKYMSSKLSSQKNEETRRKYFSKWFNKSVARYSFEDNLNDFLMYWKYIYRNDCSTTTCDLNGDGKNDSQDTKIYKNIISIIESMQNYTTADTCATKIQNNPCISICTSSAGSCTGSAFDQCTSSSGSSDYKACLSCISSRCQNIGSGEAIKACYNQCTSDKYSNQVDHYEQSKQQASTTAAQSALSIYKIFKVSDPTLDISFDNPYKIKCEDVAIFHDFYVIFQIAAPILVILFGSIDYAKAVISSDIEKMEKSKKLFPKRVMMLVLFVIIPIIIRIILDLYSKASPDNAVGTDLMECIINGK